MASRKSQSDHDSMVKKGTIWLKDNSYSDIKADVTGYISPTKITWKSTGKGHIPDITAISSDFPFHI